VEAARTSLLEATLKTAIELSRPRHLTAPRVVTVQSSLDTPTVSWSRARATRPSSLLLGCIAVTLLILLSVLGASATHGTGAAQLRRGPASILLSVLFTIGGLAGVGSLALLFWGLVTRNRRRLEGSEARRHSPVLMAGVVLAMFAVMAFLFAFAARGRHVQPLGALAGGSFAHPASTANSLPLNETVSFATTGVVVGVVVVLVLLRLVRSLGWNRALRRLSPLRGETDEVPVTPDGQDLSKGALGPQLAALYMADPQAEPDPRRAVLACYLALLDIAARYGPARRRSETPGEYLRRALSVNEAAVVPATALTRLFELARYSHRHVDETMRWEAIGALGALKEALLAGAFA
jgi:hypothetical protein